MSQRKQQIRAEFRATVFGRDGHRCVMCGRPAVDAHHITDRSLMPAGGYVAANGISLCADCHALAEQFHATGTAAPGFAPEDLYAAIGSSADAAYRESLALAREVGQA